MRKIVAVLCSLVSSPAGGESFLYSPASELTVTCDFCGYRNPDGSCHGGVDIRARTPFTVLAADAGLVVRVVDDRGNTYHVPPGQRRREYGNLVEVRHPNGYTTLYAHLEANSIQVGMGDEVERGQVLGTTDNSGWSTAPHLHFEVRDPSGRRVDPYGTDRDNTSCSVATPACGTDPLWATCPPQPWSAKEKPEVDTTCETTCSEEMVLVDAECDFCIDRYEASIASGVLGSPDGTGTTAVRQSVAAVLPRASVSWFQAREACENAGKRLCTSSEWQVACSGAAGWEYPYGATYEALTCNDENYGLASGFGVQATGTLSACVTPTGTYDMVGNVWEWTATATPVTESYVIRGGAYNMSPVSCTMEINVEDPEVEESILPEGSSSNGGFRCCR